MQVLEAYGIPVAPYRLAKTEESVVSAAAELGYPVVLKVISERVIHKSDVGGVHVGNRGRTGAPRRLHSDDGAGPPSRRHQPDDVDGMLVQQMARGGRETIIGATWDAAFGPLLMFGLGGIYVEAVGDVVFRLFPVSDVDASEMVNSIRGVRLLRGLRGEPPADTDAIAEVIQRVSQLVGDHPAIRELDINPWLAHDRGGVAVDGRMTIQTEAAV
jgi:acyl-CoA synthetase (NDP forming)